MNLNELFWSKVQILGPDDCWLWTKGKSKNGYGAFHDPLRKSNVGSHKFALELVLGRPLKDKMLACHTCDVRLCCNPNHLYEGTQSDNRNDMYSRGRIEHYHSVKTHCKRGHEFNKENTYIFTRTRDGKTSTSRICNPCRVIRNKEKMLLLRAIAGSRLYGTNKENSDYDFYEVWSETQHPRGKRKAHQTVKNGVDVIQVGFSDWVNLLYTSHQALDAVFAPANLCEVDLISDFRHSYFANNATVVPAFQRVIESFSHPDSTLKQKRHAVRLQMMIDQLLATGRYNPVLTAEQRQKVMDVK